ncbi:MAG: hypothetical protein EPN37_07090 [Chitinophagaceae bacterium]|nr:MAG: hypothetical protein EPN37_07090 [Chitinophagaceae bacterium]
MMVRNVQLLKGVPFDDYLKLPGWSYSGIKGTKIEPTPKMGIGTAVHNYLLTPNEFNHDNSLVPALAIELKKILGPLLPFCTPELAVICDLIHEDMIMPYKGRIDLAVVFEKIGNPLNLVIDIKITELDTRKGIDFFGYDKQLNGYSLAIGAARRVIVSVNPNKLAKRQVATQVIPIARDIRFWEQAVLKLGKPITHNYLIH